MPTEKMTAQDIIKEYGIGQETVYEMFKDPQLPVQTYSRPNFVLRGELLKYFSERHDYLRNTTQ